LEGRGKKEKIRERKEKRQASRLWSIAKKSRLRQKTKLIAADPDLARGKFIEKGHETIKATATTRYYPPPRIPRRSDNAQGIAIGEGGRGRTNEGKKEMPDFGGNRTSSGESLPEPGGLARHMDKAWPRIMESPAPQRTKRRIL